MLPRRRLRLPRYTRRHAAVLMSCHYKDAADIRERRCQRPMLHFVIIFACRH